jgi:diguanylate cyclase (GGDEF)-like protein
VSKPADHLKRTVLMCILALSWVSSAMAWALLESLGQSSLALRIVFGMNIVFHPIFFVITWKKLLPLRMVDVACLLFAAVLCAACMVLRLYSPAYGASIDIEPLYLWIPVIYVFVFTVSGHKASLKLSLAIFALFVAISLPYLAQSPVQPHANFTVQLHMVSAILIAALYFFSSYQHRFQIAQLTADELARLANTDELTQLANRRRMREVIATDLLRFGRYASTFSVILIDMDHFKAVNDRFGHSVGDQTLVALAVRAKDVLRDVDMLGRWGGEEFIVVLPETGYPQALQKAAALCSHVAATPLVGEHFASISCGVTTVCAGDTADTLLQRADMALYAAKHGGRNRAEGRSGEPSEAQRAAG